MKTIIFLNIICTSIYLTSVLEAKSMRWEEVKIRPFEISSVTNKEGFFSRASRDRFVYLTLYGILNKQDSGAYLEIGATGPIFFNNSYFFEKNYSWRGVSLGINEKFKDRWQLIRRNPLLLKNPVEVDYREILSPFFVDIDYLSIDLDDHFTEILSQIPFDTYRFKIITVRHDFYRLGNIYRDEERQILQAAGYHLLCEDVAESGYPFEDWWIHPSYFSKRDFHWLCSLDLNAKDSGEIICILKDSLSFQKQKK